MLSKGELVFPGIATVKLTVGEGSLQETKLLLFFLTFECFQSEVIINSKFSLQFLSLKTML